MEFNQLLMIAISVIFINNFILSKFLGLCPFIGVSRETRPAFYMGLAVTFVMTASSIITWAVYSFLLRPFHIEYLNLLLLNSLRLNNETYSLRPVSLHICLMMP